MVTYNTIPTAHAAEDDGLLNAPKSTQLRPRFGGVALIAVGLALGATIAYVAPFKASTSAALERSYGSTESGKTEFTPREIAAAWNRYANGRYAEDCPHAMAIALGEGIKPGSPLKYICDPAVKDCKKTAKGCLGMPRDQWCWADWIPHQVATLEEFLDAPVFDINQRPYDGQNTLGPWQVMTQTFHTEDINVRIGEAVTYIEDYCKDCGTQKDAKCTNPFGNYPLTTIFDDNILKWCGCPVGGIATAGWSGRCSQTRDDFYTQYNDPNLLSIANKICDSA
jgi:hypothetical protein